MNTRIGTSYFVNANAAMTYYGKQEKMGTADLRKLVAKKSQEGEIHFGRPPFKEGFIVVLNGKEGRYFYEEVPQKAAQKPLDLTAVAAQSQSAHPGMVVHVAANAQTPCTLDAEKLAQTSVLSRAESEDLKSAVESASAPKLDAEELVNIPLVAEGDSFCGFCNKPTALCECKNVGEEVESAPEPELTHGRMSSHQGGDAVHVKTNNVPRELLFFSQLTDKERADLDYVKEDTNSFFRLKDQVYDAGEFVRINHPGQIDPNPMTFRDDANHFPGWDGIYTTSYSTGVLIRYPRLEGDEMDPERVVIGTFYIGSSNPKDPRAENKVPNLDDGLDIEELRAFFTKHEGGKRIKDLFPTGGEGTKNAVRDLASYAMNKLTARELRLKGKIAKAQEYETICDRIYAELPAWAKSW